MQAGRQAKTGREEAGRRLVPGGEKGERHRNLRLSEE